MRNYKKKTDRVPASKEVMVAAAEEVRSGRLSLRRAAEDYNVKKMTLYRYVKKLKSAEEKGEDPLLVPVGYAKPRQLFSDKQEKELVTNLKTNANNFEIMSFAYEYAKKNGISVPEKWHETKKASKDWLANFMKRNPSLAVRSLQVESLGSLTILDTDNQEEFFDELEDLYEKLKLQDDFNIDETTVATVQKPCKIITRNGTKQTAIHSGDIGGISESQSEDSSHSEIPSSDPLFFLELSEHGETSSQNMLSQPGTSSSINLHAPQGTSMKFAPPALASETVEISPSPPSRLTLLEEALTKDKSTSVSQSLLVPGQNSRGVKRPLIDGKVSPELGSNQSKFDYTLLETNQIDATLNRLESISDQVDQLNGRDDTFDNFGKYVASLLRGLPIRRATELQQEVINLILTSHINSERSSVDLDLTSTTSSSTNFALVLSTVTSEAKRTMQPPLPPTPPPPPSQGLKTYQVPLSTKQKTSVPMSMHQQNKSQDRRPPKRCAQSHDTLSTTQMTGVHQALPLLQENNRQDKIPLADSDITSELGNSQSKFDDMLLETNKIDATLKRLEDISDKVSQLNRRDDSFDNFGQYAASLLRSLNIHRAMELEKEIVNIILRSLLNPLPQDT